MASFLLDDLLNLSLAIAARFSGMVPASTSSVPGMSTLVSGSQTYDLQRAGGMYRLEMWDNSIVGSSKLGEKEFRMAAPPRAFRAAARGTRALVLEQASPSGGDTRHV